MKLSMLLIIGILAVTPAFADDTAENSNKTTVEHSKNVFTGSRTKTVKRHRKNKDLNGSGSESTITEETKVEKDGDVKKDIKIEKEKTH